jgi:hypothetical protein
LLLSALAKRIKAEQGLRARAHRFGNKIKAQHEDGVFGIHDGVVTVYIQTPASSRSLKPAVQNRKYCDLCPSYAPHCSPSKVLLARGRILFPGPRIRFNTSFREHNPAPLDHGPAHAIRSHLNIHAFR